MIAAPDVDELAEQARAGGRLGIDTEFMSESRYRALLCLVQVAVPDGDGVRVEVLDPLAGVAPGPLADVLADPEVEIVLHAARQDVAILRRAWRTEVTRIFDTQVAGAFAGLGAQVGYGGLLGDVLGVRLEKGASYTRWDDRPLSDEQLAYARDDVAHLLALADALQARLGRQGRLEWAREECRRLEGVADGRDPEEAWRRLPRAGGLRPRQRAVARELAAWRERTAAREDRPPAWILPDAVLVEAARRQPTEPRGLEQIRGAQPGTIRRRGSEIVAAIARGQAAEPPPDDEAERLPSDPHDGPVVSLAEALVRTRTREAGMAYELVASRADLTAIVAAARAGATEPAVRTLQGWRRELVGAELLELLAGRRTLGVQDGRLTVRV